ncbi:nuclear RNA export factor 1-like [Ctenocephalides felis]|uniref:nuclear RNA export factor 1-like n=1 Tax=Ctenocephalides felis TaxID=7515 RepID=UPI000E6E59AF|nr:nuclear RNA export factor 1-like [Ctenocephalides felis]
MSKRGGYRSNGNRGSWNSTHFNSRFKDEHDDRTKDSTRRVSFKTNQNRHHGGQKYKNYEVSVRAHLLNENIDMTRLSTSQVRPINQRNRRGDRHEGRNRNSTLPNKKLLPGPSGFYEVMIPYMINYDRDFIIKTIHSRIQPDPFHPLYFKVDQDKAIFYVDSFPIAEKILKLDRLITLPNGQKMLIKVRSGIPKLIINENLREKMIAAFARRYNPAAKALDLSSFHTDPELSDVYCCLARPKVMIEAIGIIASRVPDLTALNLDSNNISITNHMKCITAKLPNITILHLKNNKLVHTSLLEVLKKLPLMELILEGNPLKGKFRDPSVYVREVRKLFPKLVKLDEAEIPPQISFDLGEAVDLPTSKASFLCNAGAEGIIRQFLLQYFTIYDSESRQPLLDAYHENARLSVSVFFTTEKNTVYHKVNRNLFRCRDIDSRHRTLKESRLHVVGHLTALPKTQHDPTSFQVDLTVCTPAMMLLSVSGLFKELNGENDPPTRCFLRVMAIVPAGSGFCIISEEMVINTATPSQIKGAFQAPTAPVAGTSVQPVPVSASPVAEVIPNPAVIDDSTKKQIIQQFSEYTNMKLEWSEKCLIETNWEPQRAVFVFTELSKENKIPPEAFIK